jgi:8-oxo-dGTP pyrophosphatase MutT (NUDIX family)
MSDRFFPEKLIQEFLQFRPAARILPYHITATGEVFFLLSKHGKNGQYTIGGGRFDPEKDLAKRDLFNCLLHETMFREMEEEFQLDDMAIIAAMMSGDFSYLGIMLWRHPETNQPCVDFLSAIKCKQMYDFGLPADGELVKHNWESLNTLGDSFLDLYENVALAIMQLFDVLGGVKPEEINNLSYEPADFSREEIELIKATLGKILVTPALES